MRKSSKNIDYIGKKRRTIYRKYHVTKGTEHRGKREWVRRILIFQQGRGGRTALFNYLDYNAAPWSADCADVKVPGSSNELRPLILAPKFLIIFPLFLSGDRVRVNGVSPCRRFIRFSIRHMLSCRDYAS